MLIFEIACRNQKRISI